MPKEHPATDSPASELEQLRAQVAEQAKLIEQLRQRIAELEARPAKDSHNSSKPPPRSLRTVSGRNPGGQQGHQGTTRALVDNPDHQAVIPLAGTCDCGRCRSQMPVQLLPERRQVVELVIRREVTEYGTVAGTCACGRMARSDFPADLSAPLQYGPGVSAFAVYMAHYQLLPFERAAAILDELAAIAIAPGTLCNALETAAERLETPLVAIRAALVAAPIAHAEETGMRVGGPSVVARALQRDPDGLLRPGQTWRRGAWRRAACWHASAVCSCTTTGGPPCCSPACLLQPPSPARAHRHRRDHPQPAALDPRDDCAAVRGQRAHHRGPCRRIRCLAGADGARHPDVLRRHPRCSQGAQPRSYRSAKCYPYMPRRLAL
jgi:hypothetical protein